MQIKLVHNKVKNFWRVKVTGVGPALAKDFPYDPQIVTMEAMARTCARAYAEGVSDTARLISESLAAPETTTEN